MRIIPLRRGDCVRGVLALTEYVYHPDRITTPLLRAREDRGKNKWKPISWEEALDIVEEKVNSIKEKYGAESMIVFQGTGREATLYAPAMAYAVLGTPNFTFPMSGSSCYGPRCAVADFILGAGYPELDYAAYFPDRYDDPRYKVPEYIVIWGKDPLYSSPDGFFGHSIIDLMQRGSKFITVDPRVTWCGAHAEYHLQLRPGTDAAVGLGILNVIIGEDLYDHEFVDKWCYGFDELAERASEWPPERVEEISWVPAETLRQAARAIATSKPVGFLWGLAQDEQKNGVQGGHAIIDIAAITGNLDVPGGVTLSVPASFMGKWRFDISQNLPRELWAKLITQPKYEAFTATHTLSQPDQVLETLETGEPYELKMSWTFSGNMTAVAQPHRWYEAVKKLDFNVIQDTFMTPTAMGLADLFLPVSTFAEHDGVVLPHFGRNTHFLGAINKAITVGEAKSDLEILYFFGKRLFPEMWPWENIPDFFTDQIKPKLGITWEQLRDVGTIQQEFEYRKYEKGLLRTDGKPGFNTPTGLVELASSMYPDFGEDALPYFEEPPLSPNDPEVASEYPLVLTTGGRSIVSFHSEHRQIPSLREIAPDAIVQIHPDTAKEYGIKEGDWVCMENPFGKCIEKAHLTPILDPRVVHASHGWWYPEQDGEEPNLYGFWKSNPNNLMSNNVIGRLGFGANYKSSVCKIYKVDSLDDTDGTLD